jgi:hypothetical protein
VVSCGLDAAGSEYRPDGGAVNTAINLHVP